MAYESNGESADIDGGELPADVAVRLERQLISWREKLLALDRRQRLLYFKHTKSASLEILLGGTEGLLELVTAGDVPVRPQPEAGETTRHGRSS